MTLSFELVPKIIAILPAAGIGSRMHTHLAKQYLTIGDKTLLEFSIESILCNPLISRIIVAINHIDNEYYKLPISLNPKIKVVIGGNSRASSVMSALNSVCKTTKLWILTHDAVRPCLHKDDLHRLLTITRYAKVGGILAYPVKDSIKRISKDSNFIIKTIDNTTKNLWCALTPQLFKYSLLKKCLKYVLSKGIKVPDESSALEYCGYKPILIQGRSDNIKVTYPEDLVLARLFLNNR